MSSLTENCDLNAIQRDMMPKWKVVDEAEKISIDSMLNSWQTRITAQFELCPSDSKYMKPFDTEEIDFNQREDFDFQASKQQLNSLVYVLYALCTSCKNELHTTSLDETIKNPQPNTRLLLKAFKKFYLALECLEKVQQGTKKVRKKLLKIFSTNSTNQTR
jgi:hypothetical protein